MSDNFIRRYCDGELSSDEAADVQRRLDGIAGAPMRVEFERALKERVSQAMRSVPESTAPPGLADRVRAGLAAAGREAPSQDQASAGEAMPRPRPARLSWRNAAAQLARPQRVNVFAVAACLMLVGGAVLLGIFGRPIDSYGHRTVSMLTQAAEYVSREHGRCAADDLALHDKMKYPTAQEAAAELGHHLGAPVLVPDLTAMGYQFQGGGPCQVPGDERSGHLMYRKAPSQFGGRSPMVSIFIEPNHGQFIVFDGELQRNLVPGAVYDFPTGKACRPGMVITDGLLVYFVTACDVHDLEAVNRLIIGQEFHPAGR